jgi:uncharacterized protein
VQVVASPEKFARGLSSALIAQRFPKLQVLDLAITFRCPLHCDYCFVRQEEKKDMPWETARGAIDFLIRESRDAQELSVSFVGGEPLCAWDLLVATVEYGEKAALAAGKKIAWDITTNGVLLDEEKLRFLRSNGISFLLSMDGHHSAHDAHRKMGTGAPSSPSILPSLKLFKSYQPYLGVRWTISPDTVPLMTSGFSELLKHHFNHFIVARAEGVAWTESDCVSYLEQIISMYDVYLECVRSGITVKTNLFGHIGHSRCETRSEVLFGCGAGRGRCCIAPDGVIAGCAKLASVRQGGLLPFGSLETGFDNYENRAVLNRDHAGPRIACQDCQYAGRTCNGGCAAGNYLSTGDPWTPDPSVCMMQRLEREILDPVFGSVSAQEKLANARDSGARES